MFICVIATLHDFLWMIEIFKSWIVVFFSLIQFQVKCLLKGSKQKI